MGIRTDGCHLVDFLLSPELHHLLSNGMCSRLSVSPSQTVSGMVNR